MKKFFSKLSLIAVLVFSSFQSFAAESAWQNSSPQKEGSIRLITASSSTEGKILSGIQIKFTNNWHTYWKITGDSGMPVSADFSASENIKNAQLLWPIPKRNLFFDLEGWGYGGEVIFPVTAEAIDPTKPSKLDVEVKWAVCDENCIFVDNKLTLDIPADYSNVENQKTIEPFMAIVPKMLSADSTVKLKTFEADDKAITAKFTSPAKFTADTDLFLYDDSKNFRYPKPAVKLSEDGTEVTIKTTFEVLKKNETLEGKNIHFALRNGDQSYEGEKKITNILLSPETKQQLVKEVTTPLAETETQRETAPSLPKVSLKQAIIAALLGGLILNIMPCVLPVLFLKIFGVLKHGSSDKKFIRRSFAYTIAGILFSFIVLAVFVIILKSLGHSIGWGIQFQQPAFLAFLSILLTLFAANQFGWLEFSIPYKLAERLNINIDKAGDSTPVGNFLTGAFATLLATPCSAPFLVTAISFAFAADAFTILIIMIFMGIGLSLPYILMMISPSLVKIFPRPGRWMKYVKVVLGLLLFATNFWIFTIFFTNGGVNSGFMLLVCTILMTLWLMIAKIMKLDRTKTFLTVIWMVICTFGITLYLAKIEKEPENMRDIWVQFDKQKINEYVNNGKVVFVDVTADWCLTCKFNKSNVIYPMYDYFKEHGVILMKADYTSPSKLINDYLAENKAYGIPFNKVYGPNAKNGLILPVLLKRQDMEDAINKAKKQ